MEKIVFYTQRVEVVEGYNERRDCADQKISKFLNTCGFVPIALPNNVEIASQIIDILKPVGIVLTGGNSLAKYGGNAPEKDELDMYLIKNSIDNKIPLYGFCRGMQSILDYFGESLIEVSNHVRVNHEITGIGNSRIVNSFHNQACVSLVGDELISLMTSSDGVIEAIKHRCLPIYGTMWHPERNNPFCDEDILFVKRIFGE